MKKILVTILANLVICFTVKAQHIPDNNFADVIRKNCSECIDANNDLLPAAKFLKKLKVHETINISNIEGVEGFTSLEELDCGYNQNITSMPSLPASLKVLWIWYTGITNIRSLPPQLVRLDCAECPLTSLPTLPASLKFLWCPKSGLTSLPTLPDSLREIDCNKTQITSLPKLPAALRILNIYGTKITTLPALPNSLTDLMITENTFDCIRSNNADLAIRNFDRAHLTIPFCPGYPKTVEVIAEKKPVNDEGKCIAGNCKNGIGTYITNGGVSTYKGSFKDGLMDGKGVVTTPDGTYTGEWKKGNINGTGTMIFKNGKKSTGIWKEGKLWSGTGFFQYGEKETYYGGVKENRADGQGVYNFESGNKYGGSFKNGKLDGYGVMTYSDGWTYKGNWTDGKKNGMGAVYDANKNLDYNDDWTNDEMSHPERSVSYKKKLWENAKENFSRVTFKGWENQNVDGKKGSIDIMDEYHLNSDYTLYGTHETIVQVGDTKYREKTNITGTYDPLTHKIHIVEGSSIYEDELPEGLNWVSGSFNGIVYDHASHSGYHIIQGKTSGGNDYELSDYY